MIDNNPTFINDIDSTLKTELENFYENCETILNRRKLVNLPEDLCKQSMTLLKTLTQDNTDLDNIQMQDVIRVMKAVNGRVSMFGDDIKTMLKYCRKMTNDSTDRFDYLEKNYMSKPYPTEYVYINRKLKAKIKNPMVVAEEVEGVFKRMVYKDDTCIIEPYPADRRVKDPSILPINFTKISL